MLPKNWKKEILSIPNLLSLFRLFLIPVYILLYLRAIRTNCITDFYVTAGILAVSSLTDMIDGKIARRFNMVTTVGKALDPIADKLTQLAVIICLCVKYPVLWLLVMLFVVKESYQLIAMLLFMRKGLMLNGAKLSGKISTTVMFTTMILMVLLPSLSHTTVAIITAVNCLVMLVAFIDYAHSYATGNHIIPIPDTENNPQNSTDSAK